MEVWRDSLQELLLQLYTMGARVQTCACLGSQCLYRLSYLIGLVVRAIVRHSMQ